MRIATVTFNPAIDQTITLDRLVPGEVHRARSIRQDAGGKGVNVASCLADWGAPVTTFGLLGEGNAALFEMLFEQKAIQDRFIRIAGDTRVNMKIVDDTDTTDINMSGPVVGEADVAQVTQGVAAFAGEAALIVLSGSLPPGCDPILYAEMVATLTARGARVLLDTSGAPLTQALRADVLPMIVKPNRRELAAWADTSLETMADVVGCAIALHRRGVALVVVSMGGDGALFVSEEGALVAHLPAGALASTVGAGDAMVAGLAAGIAEGAGLERIARLSTAFAVAKLGRLGPHLPDLATIDALAAQVTISGAGITGPSMVGEDA
ncbi:1-phosphofructokinase [Sphingomonas sp. SORGH_AS_0879]|uniref:1-phosphofructokinase n=1 Tax=Sphingomonas sp. SORGH_AS_0879 TaxID=3041790 RepID=UPI0027854BD3|nr:1-phosphofructokinase [Sphingomonas sp. SORGH_AS_0879]MDQ1231189.1 1-phosphofructokinase [Sphingomonas sp. SORGH_AS_0879]